MNEHSSLDKATYDSSRIYLRATLEHMLEAGRSVRELSEFALEKFGAEFLPYLRQFLYDVGHGRITVKGLSHSAQTALAGHSVSSAERECMIREAAYLRAERRGFCGGSAEQDWLEAEHEVDIRLAQGVGLIAKGSRALASVAAAVEEELAISKQAVTRWLEKKSPARAVARRKQPATRTERSSKPDGQSAVGIKRASAATDKKPAREKATGTTAVKKTPAKKTPANKTAANKTTAKKTAETNKTVKKKTSSARAPSSVTGSTPNRKKTSATRKKTPSATRKKRSR